MGTDVLCQAVRRPCAVLGWIDLADDWWPGLVVGSFSKGAKWLGVAVGVQATVVKNGL